MRKLVDKVDSSGPARHLALILLAAVLAIWFLQTTRSAWCIDESAHIAAGLYHFETGRLDAYRVNPPLPRMIAAIPLLIDRPVLDWHTSRSPYDRIEFEFAHLWVRDNAASLPRYLFLTRSTTLIFFALGIVVVGIWAWRLHGRFAGWVAAILWSFNPDIITYSAVVGPDLPAAATGLLAGYAYWDWQVRRRRSFPWAISVTFALAIMCKFTWLILLPLTCALTVALDLARGSRIERICESDSTAVRSFWRIRERFRPSLLMLLASFLTLTIVNGCYGFDGTGRRLGDFEFISRALAGSKTKYGAPGNRFEASALANMPAPLPAEMLQGIDYLKWEFEHGMESYLFGQWYDRGLWYFYICAMAVKLPAGYLFLIGAGVIGFLWTRFRSETSQQLGWFPIVVAFVFICAMSAEAGYTHHVRYVLPSYGFLFIFASGTVAVLPRRFAVCIVCLCLSGTLWFHATHLGLAHTFFNSLAGGPNNGWRYLSFSNVDWGQSTYRIAKWVNDHPQQRPVYVLFCSTLGDPNLLIAHESNVFGPSMMLRDRSQRHSVPSRAGYYLMSSFHMTLPHNHYFRERTPVDQPYPDVLLFYVSNDEISDQAISAGH